MEYQFDFSVIWEAWPLLLAGIVTTIYYTLVASILSLIIGLLVMVARRSDFRAIRYTAIFFIEIVRNTPFLVQLFFVFFGLPMLGMKLSVAAAAVLALTVNAAAYVAEIVRAGVDGLPRGQIEAGKALGLTGRQIFFDIVLKPSLRSVYPGLCSQFLLLMLTTSVVSSISVKDLTYMTQMIEGQTFRSFEAYFTSTAIYLGMSLIMSTMMRLFGKFYFSYPAK